MALLLAKPDQIWKTIPRFKIRNYLAMHDVTKCLKKESAARSVLCFGPWIIARISGRNKPLACGNVHYVPPLATSYYLSSLCHKEYFSQEMIYFCTNRLFFRILLFRCRSLRDMDLPVLAQQRCTPAVSVAAFPERLSHAPGTLCIPGHGARDIVVWGISAGSDLLPLPELP